MRKYIVVSLALALAGGSVWAGGLDLLSDPEASYTADPSSTGYGSDFGLQPIMRTFIWGLNLTF